MGGASQEILIVDANVLIDFCATDPSVLGLVTKHVAALNVAEPVLDEVTDLDRSLAERLGLRIVCPDYDSLCEATTLSAKSPLGFQDWICLLLAKQAEWICVTNDKRLRRECVARQVATWWGLELLLCLVTERALSATDAIALAEAMHRVNRRLTRDVVDEFAQKARRAHGT